MKSKALKLVTLGLSIIAIAILVMAIMLVLFFKYTGFIGTDFYVMCNPEKVITPLERTFILDFPDDMKDAKAAIGHSWDNWSMYIIKFEAETRIAEVFLVSVGDVKPYNQSWDERGLNTYKSPALRWFTQPIRRGKMGRCSAGPKCGFDACVYVDSSQAKNHFVYLMSFGHGSLDN